MTDLVTGAKLFGALYIRNATFHYQPKFWCYLFSYILHWRMLLDINWSEEMMRSWYYVWEYQAYFLFCPTFSTLHDKNVNLQGVSKKTSFCQNWQWRILLLIMRNPLSFSMTNVGDSFCNSYIYHLVGLHISDIGKEISSLVTCWGLWTATVRHSWAALWVLVIDPPQS